MASLEMMLYNKHRGETCLVIGNGPSLKDVPFGFLSRYSSFGANRIYLLLGFTPTYYVCVNPLVRQQFINEIMTLRCPKFMGGGPSVAPDQDIINLRSVNVPLFSYAPLEWIYEGYTVTFVSLQLAYYMGFSTVLLVGVDHRYQFVGEPNEETRYGGADINHFDPSYFSERQWNNPDLERSAEAYRLAKTAFESDGRKIINLTEGTALDVFDCEPLEKWL